MKSKAREAIPGLRTRGDTFAARQDKKLLDAIRDGSEEKAFHYLHHKILPFDRRMPDPATIAELRDDPGRGAIVCSLLAEADRPGVAQLALDAGAIDEWISAALPFLQDSASIHLLLNSPAMAGRKAEPGFADGLLQQARHPAGAQAAIELGANPIDRLTSLREEGVRNQPLENALLAAIQQAHDVLATATDADHAQAALNAGASPVDRLAALQDEPGHEALKQTLLNAVRQANSELGAAQTVAQAQAALQRGANPIHRLAAMSDAEAPNPAVQSLLKAAINEANGDLRAATTLAQARAALHRGANPAEGLAWVPDSVTDPATGAATGQDIRKYLDRFTEGANMRLVSEMAAPAPNVRETYRTLLEGANAVRGWMRLRARDGMMGSPAEQLLLKWINQATQLARNATSWQQRELALLIGAYEPELVPSEASTDSAPAALADPDSAPPAPAWEPPAAITLRGATGASEIREALAQGADLATGFPSRCDEAMVRYLLDDVGASFSQVIQHVATPEAARPALSRGAIADDALGFSFDHDTFLVLLASGLDPQAAAQSAPTPELARIATQWDDNPTELLKYAVHDLGLWRRLLEKRADPKEALPLAPSPAFVHAVLEEMDEPAKQALFRETWGRLRNPVALDVLMKERLYSPRIALLRAETAEGIRAALSAGAQPEWRLKPRDVARNSDEVNAALQEALATGGPSRTPAAPHE